MKKSPKYVSAAYLSERTSLTTRWFPSWLLRVVPLVGTQRR
jgi:hypothetical protein